MDITLTTALALGLLLGLRHAMDADHVVAVSTLVSQHGGITRSCLLGVFWGAGHTMALLGASIAVIGFKVTISPEVERGLETIVAMVLILLGGHVLLKSASAMLVRSEHVHGGQRHSHLHAGAHVHLLRAGSRPFLVGLLHGLAGSAALTLLALATMPSALEGLVYLLVFGIGSTVGMLVLSGLIGIPFALTAGRAPRFHAVVQALAGATSVTLGVTLVRALG